MGITEEPWTCQDPAAKRLQLVLLRPAVLTALAGGDLEAARRATALELTPYLVSAECVGVWRMRRDQIARSQADAAWVTRLAVDTESGKVVGRAGYHGPPDETGMIEVGYSIDPGHRRQGYARAALVILLATAREHPGISVVRASVRPDNIPSRRLLDQYGFQEAGEQWDDEDGLESILQVPSRG